MSRLVDGVKVAPNKARIREQPAVVLMQVMLNKLNLGQIATSHTI